MPISNIRLLQRIQSDAMNTKHSSIIEYEKAQEELWSLNHQFWLENNMRFEKELEEYKADMNMKDQDLDTLKAIKDWDNAEKMAGFYRKYLITYGKEFKAYHIVWCKKNGLLTLLAIRANFFKIILRLKLLLSTHPKTVDISKHY